MKKVLFLTLALVMIVCVSAASAKDIVIAFSQIGQESDFAFHLHTKICSNYIGQEEKIKFFLDSSLS